MQDERATIGIDVAQAVLDVWTHPSGVSWRTAHDASGREELVQALRPLAPYRVVVEATGGLELPRCPRRNCRW